jgi:hypothetical protein
MASPGEPAALAGVQMLGIAVAAGNAGGAAAVPALPQILRSRHERSRLRAWSSRVSRGMPRYAAVPTVYPALSPKPSAGGVGAPLRFEDEPSNAKGSRRKAKTDGRAQELRGRGRGRSGMRGAVGGPGPARTADRSGSAVRAARRPARTGRSRGFWCWMELSRSPAAIPSRGGRRAVPGLSTPQRPRGCRKFKHMFYFRPAVDDRCDVSRRHGLALNRAQLDVAPERIRDPGEERQDIAFASGFFQAPPLPRPWRRRAPPAPRERGPLPHEVDRPVPPGGGALAARRPSPRSPGSTPPLHGAAPEPGS